MRGRRPLSVASNPVFVGAVTVLVVLVAVLLAYQANQGLPFVPTFELKVDTPNAARLVVGNEVREGGFRIGQVAQIDPIANSPRGAQLTLHLDTSAA
ncbi:MAG: phospholipid/cholesterol/gamma-HCH transport system substrate-binding protein, partial [Solirubrobacteraceae bacterium]|nr:phospholipid/cholesterol/gamma-HCH transport system substrate-binding protein [Solirubrobacteraceae bacterium]